MLKEIRLEDNLVSVLSFKWKREINWNKFKDMIDSKDVALCFYKKQEFMLFDNISIRAA